MTYEEGGCNGSIGSLGQSTVALLLVPSKGNQTRVDVWCVPLMPDAKAFNISTNVLGAAFCCPPKLEKDGLSFTPLVCLITEEMDVLIGERMQYLQIEKLKINDIEFSLSREEVLERILLDVGERNHFQEPILATGPSPLVLILSLENVIVVIFRSYGLVMAFLYDGSITKLGHKNTNHYIVDASICRGDVKGEVKVIVLLSLPSLKDGFVGVIHISQVGCLC